MRRQRDLLSAVVFVCGDTGWCKADVTSEMCWDVGWSRHPVITLITLSCPVLGNFLTTGGTPILRSKCSTMTHHCSLMQNRWRLRCLCNVMVLGVVGRGMVWYLGSMVDRHAEVLIVDSSVGWRSTLTMLQTDTNVQSTSITITITQLTLHWLVGV